MASSGDESRLNKAVKLENINQLPKVEKTASRTTHKQRIFDRVQSSNRFERSFPEGLQISNSKHRSIFDRCGFESYNKVPNENNYVLRDESLDQGLNNAADKEKTIREKPSELRMSPTLVQSKKTPQLMIRNTAYEKSSPTFNLEKTMSNSTLKSRRVQSAGTRELNSKFVQPNYTSTPDMLFEEPEDRGYKAQNNYNLYPTHESPTEETCQKIILLPGQIDPRVTTVINLPARPVHRPSSLRVHRSRDVLIPFESSRCFTTVDSAPRVMMAELSPENPFVSYVRDRGRIHNEQYENYEKYYYEPPCGQFRTAPPVYPGRYNHDGQYGGMTDLVPIFARLNPDHPSSSMTIMTSKLPRSNNMISDQSCFSECKKSSIINTVQSSPVDHIKSRGIPVQAAKNIVHDVLGSKNKRNIL